MTNRAFDLIWKQEQLDPMEGGDWEDYSDTNDSFSESVFVIS